MTRRKEFDRKSAGLILLLAVLSCSSTSIYAGEKQNAENTTPSPVTYNRDIAPIVFRSCARCHRPGEAGPFPLLTYNNVKAHARQIVTVTEKRTMPPWLPAPQDLTLADDLRLADLDITMFRK